MSTDNNANSLNGSITEAPVAQDTNRKLRRPFGWLLLAGIALLTAFVVGLGMWTVDHTSEGSSRRQFTIQVDFDTFRQIMVRKNATEAIVSHSGMKLLDERVDDISIDLPKQHRPILKAILGKAKANVSASKQITVSVDDTEIGVDQLTLKQFAEIQPEMMDVRTETVDPAGNLKAYTTRLRASKDEGRTKVELAIDQTIAVKVPRFFVSVADRRVQEAADKSTEEQEQAIRNFIGKFDEELVVLPQR